MNAINLLVEGVEVVVEGVVGVNGLGFVGEAGALAAAEVAVAEWGERVATLRFAALLWVVEVVVLDFEGGLLGRIRLVPGPWDHFYEVFEHLAPAIVQEELDEALAERLLGLSEVVEAVVEEAKVDVFQVVIKGSDGSEYRLGGLSFEVANQVENSVTFALEAAGLSFVEPEQVWRAESGHEVEVLLADDFEDEPEEVEVEEFDWLKASDEEISVELDRLEAIERAKGWDGEPELTEYEQGWANIRAEERAAVARQVKEDAEWERRPRSSYQGVEGRWNPEDGWIYEP